MWIDGAHNLHAAQAVAPYLDARVKRPRTLVFGIMQDKDVRGVIDTLVPLFDSVITTEPYPPRNASAAHLVEGAVAEPEPKRAFERALRSPGKSVVIAGSLYLAGAAIEYFDAKRGGGERKKK